MNRTATLLGLAGALALVAILVGVRAPSANPTTLPGPHPVDPVSSPLPPPMSSGPGSLSLVGRSSNPVIPVGTSDIFLTADVTGTVIANAERSPVDLALVIDRSGSMSGDKIENARAAARALVSQLLPTDTLTIIHYGSDVRMLKRHAADAAGKEAMLAYIDSIRVDGGTNLSGALQRARAAMAGSDAKVRRAILISDGVPTEGDTEPSHLLRLAEQIHQSGISVSAIGVGLDFNENLMAGIAERGSGAYGFLKDSSALATLFEKDLQQASRQVARGVQLSFQLPEGVTLTEVYGRTFTREGNTVTVQLPDLSSGQLERVVVRAQVHGDRPGQRVALSNLTLHYRDLLAERDASTQVALASEVSARQEEVLARRDTQAVIVATRAQAAANLQAAADSLREGSPEKAKGLLDKNATLYRQANALAGAPVMKEDEAYDRGFMPPPSAAPAVREAAVKDAKARARANFGSAGSTYSIP